MKQFKSIDKFNAISFNQIFNGGGTAKTFIEGLFFKINMENKETVSKSIDYYDDLLSNKKIIIDNDKYLVLNVCGKHRKTNDIILQVK